MNTKERYKVYKTNNLPLPLSTKHNILLLEYDLETEMLMVWKERAKFSLLSESTYHLCNSYHISFVIQRQRPISPMLTSPLLMAYIYFSLFVLQEYDLMLMTSTTETYF